MMGECGGVIDALLIFGAVGLGLYFAVSTWWMAHKVAEDRHRRWTSSKADIDVADSGKS